MNAMPAFVLMDDGRLVRPVVACFIFLGPIPTQLVHSPRFPLASDS